MPPLIAFTGPAGSGKTAAALALVQQCGALRLSFADPIRDMLRALGVSSQQLTIDKHEPIDWLGERTPRQLMQTLGTEWGRALVAPDVWASVTERRIFEAWNAGECVVIDDCRFDNEAEMLRRLGGKVIEIHRPGLARMSHASERGVTPELIDVRIDNAADHAQFIALVVAVVGNQRG